MSADIDPLTRLLGYVYESENAFNRPLWLCPQQTWIDAEKEGLIEPGARKPFIAREGSYFQGYRLTDLGRQKFFNELPRLSK